MANRRPRSSRWGSQGGARGGTADRGSGRGGDGPAAKLDLPPLPAALGQAVDRSLGSGMLPAAANAGLVFARYLRVWRGGSRPQPAKTEHRTGQLSRFAGELAGQSRVRRRELEAVLRRLEEVSDSHRDFETTGPLAVGLGADHPTENSLHFDHTLGLPVIPGSSVKGLVRWAALVSGAPDDELEELLGSEHPNLWPAASSAAPDTDATRGRLVVLGAWPVGWPRLRCDIVNPHHPAYHHDQSDPRSGQKGERALPSLTEEPRPSTFLVVAPGARFRFFIRGASGRRLGDDELARAWTWLGIGLAHLGVGAKTAAGYGHMRPRER